MTDSNVRRQLGCYLRGLWGNEREAVVHARVTKDLEDYIGLKVAARSVNLVIEPGFPVSFDVYVELDGRWLTTTEAGEDVAFDSQGRRAPGVRRQ